MSALFNHLRFLRRLNKSYVFLFTVGVLSGTTIALVIYDNGSTADTPLSAASTPAANSRTTSSNASDTKAFIPFAPKTSAKKGATSIMNGSTITSVKSIFETAPSWTQNFAAQPLGPIDETHWVHDSNPEVPGYNNEKQGYTPNNVAIKNDVLVIEARKESYKYPGDARSFGYTSGKVMTYNPATRTKPPKGLTFEYGKIVARMKMPTGAGTWPAFWLLSANQPYTSKLNPTDADWSLERFYLHDGEIDIVEHYGNHRSTEGTLHVFNKTYEKEFTVPDAETAFHDYGIEITPEKLTWTVDGKEAYSVTKPSNSPDDWPVGNGNQWYAIINLAMGGSGGGVIDNHTGPWTLEVAHVNFYDYTGPK